MAWRSCRPRSPRAAAPLGCSATPRRVRRAAEDALVGRGLHEVVGWSFTDPGLLDWLRLPGGSSRCARS